MFPEGKRSTRGELITAFRGSTLVTVRSGAPVLPVAISGSDRINGIGSLFQRRHIDVVIGKPFTLPVSGDKATRAELAELTEFIMRHIAELLPPSRRGIYGTEGSRERGPGD